MLRRMLRVIEPVRISFGFFAELNVDDGAAINESVEIIEILSKLSRFRLFVVSKSHGMSSAVPSSSSAMLCKQSDFKGPIIGDSLIPVTGLSAAKSMSSSWRTTPSKAAPSRRFELLGVDWFSDRSIADTISDAAVVVVAATEVFKMTVVEPFGVVVTIELEVVVVVVVGEGRFSGKWLAVFDMIWKFLLIFFVLRMWWWFKRFDCCLNGNYKLRWNMLLRIGFYKNN